MTARYYTPCLLLCFAAVLTAAEPANSETYLRTIRANDLKTLKEISASGLPQVRDRLDWTPLHYAAIYGSNESVRILLDAGADPNARNKSQATPLIYAAWSLERARMMVEKGGDVNAATSDGITPLWVAEATAECAQTVPWFLGKGADAKQVRANGVDHLTHVAGRGNSRVLQALLDKGADARHVTKSGDTAIDAAISLYTSENVSLLIKAGANVNVANTDGGTVRNGPIESTGVTPLMDAAASGHIASVPALLQAGAKVNTQDNRKMTALMMAVATDRARPETVRQLIAGGADVNLKDRNGETALDWARKFRNPEVLALLTKAGAKEQGLTPAPVKPSEYKPDAKTAIDRASTLLTKSSEVFFRDGGGCVGCHHQPFAARAFAAVKAAGLQPDPKLRQILMDGMTPNRAVALNRGPLLSFGGGGYDSLLYPMVAFADLGEPATDVTDVVAHEIAQSQEPSGVWSLPSARPPLQESDITRTMMAIYVLKTYAWPARQAEFTERIARGRNWLRTATVYTTLDEIDRLMGLWLAGESAAEVKKLGTKLLAQQRTDGGWAQTPFLESDALGTAAALYTLRKAGQLNASDPAWQKGAKFLLDTQFPDGSWYVRSRAVKLQPYFQSAFPFNHDQWISNSATGYAVMALAPLAGH
jgi:ankyrin repeat protein